MEHDFRRGHEACKACGMSRVEAFVSGAKCRPHSGLCLQMTPYMGYNTKSVCIDHSVKSKS